MSKLALGTAQFGMDYGINNIRGKVPLGEVFDILALAHNQNITTLDTAYNYGESEKVIGKYIKKYNVQFDIISKLPADVKNFEIFLTQSLKNLKIDTLYGYLFHNFESFKNNPHTFKKLLQYKEKGIIKKIGFSLYYPEELDYLLDKKIAFDIVQVPYNIFDQRFVNYFDLLKKNSIEIYIRSVFLQGLLFKNPQELTPFFQPIQKKLTQLQSIASKNTISVASLCLNFILANDSIDKVIIGVDTKKNLEENISVLNDTPKIKSLYPELMDLRESNEKIILPIYWPTS